MSDVVERAEAALRNTIPGPWEVVNTAPMMNGIPLYQVKPAGRPGVALGGCADGESALFIAAARSLVPELVAELKTTRARLDDALAQIPRRIDPTPLCPYGCDCGDCYGVVHEDRDCHCVELRGR